MEGEVERRQDSRCDVAVPLVFRSANETARHMGVLSLFFVCTCTLQPSKIGGGGGSSFSWGILSVCVVIADTSTISTRPFNSNACGSTTTKHGIVWLIRTEFYSLQPCSPFCRSTSTSTPFPSAKFIVCLFRWVCSGTPVQNNLGELLALLSFLMPEIFRSDVIEILLEFLGDNAEPSSSSSSSSSFQVHHFRTPAALRW